MRSLDFHAERAAAQRHPCPFCGAAPGETCRNTAAGGQLQNLPAHTSRIRATQARGETSGEGVSVGAREDHAEPERGNFEENS